MNTIRIEDTDAVADRAPAIQVKHFVRGKLVSGIARAISAPISPRRPSISMRWSLRAPKRPRCST